MACPNTSTWYINSFYRPCIYDDGDDDNDDDDDDDTNGDDSDDDSGHGGNDDDDNDDDDDSDDDDDDDYDDDDDDDDYTQSVRTCRCARVRYVCHRTCRNSWFERDYNISNLCDNKKDQIPLFQPSPMWSLYHHHSHDRLWIIECCTYDNPVNSGSLSTYVLQLEANLKYVLSQLLKLSKWTV